MLLITGRPQRLGSADAARPNPPGPQQLQLHMTRRKAVEQAAASSEQHRYDVQLNLIQLPGLQTRLRSRGAVHHDVPARGRLPRLRHTGPGVGDIPRVPRRGLVRNRAGQDEHRNTIVMIAGPSAGVIKGAAPGHDRAGRHHLIEHLGVRTAGRTMRGRVDPPVAQPGVQPFAVHPEPLTGSIVRAGDKSVDRHRHVEPDLACSVSHARTDRRASRKSSPQPLS